MEPHTIPNVSSSSPQQSPTHSCRTQGPTFKANDPTSEFPNPDKFYLSTLALRFTHFREERIETLLYSVCRLLGRYGNLQVVADHLIDLYQSSVAQRKELLIILAQVFTGTIDAQVTITVVINTSLRIMH